MNQNLDKNPASTQQPFSKIRNLLWPIYNYEMKKFIPLALIMCCILFNYTVFRNTKDTLIVTSAGAGTITFLKTYAVTPAGILFFLLYAKLSNIFNSEKIFYVLLTPFLIFFGLFAFVLNPILPYIHPSAETIAVMKENYPALKGFINIYANWLYSLFFVLAELWGTVILSLGFWQFANQITRMSEAKRFYGLFVVVSNLALILCGMIVSFSSQGIVKYLPEGADHWQWSLKILMTISIIVGIACMALYRWMHTAILPDPRYYDGPKATKKKEKPGLIDSFKIIFTSKVLGFIVALVICYGVTINLVEVQWKNQVGIYFAGNKGAMNAFWGSYSSWTGTATIFFALFFGSNILRKFGWFGGAIFTPITILVTGTLFYTFIFGKDKISALIAGGAYSPAMMATYIGAVVIILSKAAKYSLFDPTKEMAYIPFDEQIRTKGKAAVEVAGGRLGKSGGSLTQSTLLMVMGTANIVEIAGLASGMFIIMSIVWIYAVKGLSAYIKTEDIKA